MGPGVRRDDVRKNAWALRLITRRANQVRIHQIKVQPLREKYSDFPKTQITSIIHASRPTEGRLAIVTDAGRDAVDADGAIDERRLRRTAKSCGPDTPTLVSSFRGNYPA